MCEVAFDIAKCFETENSLHLKNLLVKKIIKIIKIIFILYKFFALTKIIYI